ncbi:hypothetical protein HDK64DRAFT_323021 [Phyllosticta capitalensis]
MVCALMGLILFLVVLLTLHLPILICLQVLCTVGVFQGFRKSKLVLKLVSSCFALTERLNIDTFRYHCVGTSVIQLLANMPAEPITPGSPVRSAHEDEPMDDAPSDMAGSTKPAEIPYSRIFEDGIMDVILNPPPADGEQAKEPLPHYMLGRNVDIPPNELPLPLNDPRRKYQSHLPGVKLTHPMGAYEGGPADLSEDEKAFAAEFIKKYGIKTKEDLERAKQIEIDAAMEEMRRVAQARKEAIEENQKIERELKALNDQREVELRAEKNIIEKAKERKAKKTKLKGTSEV